MKTHPYSCGISIYPDFKDAAQINEIQQYILLAASLGFHEVFGSLHLPELDYSEHLAQIAALGEFIQSCDMELSLDISGNALRKFISTPSALAQLRAIPLNYLRLDYGFTAQQCVDVVKKLALPGVMLNASVLNQGEILETVGVLRNAFPTLKLRGHHNFYPRPETGLSKDFMVQRSLPFHSLGISVTACIASHTRPRMPLCAGLPTVEEHRAMGCERATAELLGSGVVDSILIGDCFAGQEQLREVKDRCNNQPLMLKLLLDPAITETEKSILLNNPHHARPDQAAYAIRSQSSRQMAAFGTKVSPRACGQRERGTVTIDNTNYLRYSGELQIVLSSLPEDARVNTVGHIHPEDLWKLDYISPGSDFYFTQE